MAVNDATLTPDELYGTWKIEADDSTRTAGAARITVRSLSGCGVLTLKLVVSGILQGSKTVTVRTTDTDASGRTTTADQTSPCDLNYNGSGDDGAIVAAHVDHWHRNALHGTMVRRTSLCGTCPEESSNTIGDSEVSWSPDGSKLAFSVFTGPTADCAITLVPSDPKDGNALTQWSFPPSGHHDYDPDWSPLGTEIAFDRGDSTIYAAPAGAGTQLRLITHHDNLPAEAPGDVMPAISPDGEWVAFCRKVPNGPFQLWKIKAEGTPSGATPIQLTSDPTAEDLYPRWSPDGRWIIFDRRIGSGPRQTHRISKDGGTVQPLLTPPAILAVTPAYSPDGAVLVAGTGDPDSTSTRTLDAALAGQTSLDKAVLNYPDHILGLELGGFPIPSPRFSPDGTRLALRSMPPGLVTQRAQLWASRRNMSLPPSISTVGGVPITDATPFVNFPVKQDSTLTLTVARSDPEGDAIADSAFFLQPALGMSFHPGTRTFTWPVGDAAPDTYVVRFQAMTPNGGTDYALARIMVSDTIRPVRVADLRKICFDGTYAELAWTAPADDSSFAASGPGTLYDLRYRTSAINTEADFNAASPVVPGPPNPSSPGTTEHHSVTDLAVGVTYYFRMKTRDDVGNWSVMSNPLTFVAIPHICGEGFVGGGGGGGSGLQRVAGSVNLEDQERWLATENSLFDGAVAGERKRDVLRLPGDLMPGESYRAWVRASENHSIALDVVRLLAVDHGVEGRAYVLGSVAVVGSRLPPTRVTTGNGVDITADVSGSDVDGVLLQTGDEVIVELGAPGMVALDARRAGTTGPPESSGILLQVPDEGGWHTTGQYYPRREFDEMLVDCGAAETIQLLLLSNCWLRFCGRLVPEAETPAVQTPLESARDARFGDVRTAVLASDSAAAIVTGPDTLNLGFSVPPPCDGQVRDWFLVVEGTLLSDRTAAAGRIEHRPQASPAVLLLQQNQPNPVGEATNIRFELPRGTPLRLEVYDVLGRRIRVLADGYFPAGHHEVVWDGRDERGRLAVPGVYFYTLEAPMFRARKKMVVLP